MTRTFLFTDAVSTDGVVSFDVTEQANAQSTASGMLPSRKHDTTALDNGDTTDSDAVEFDIEAQTIGASTTAAFGRGCLPSAADERCW